MTENLIRHTLSVDGVRDAADAETLEAELRRVPGLESVDVDAAAGEVALTVETDRAVGDAKWVVDHYGYELV